MDTHIIGFDARDGYAIAKVQYSDEYWTSPVVELPSNGTAGIDRAAAATAENVEIFRRVAEGMRGELDGSVRNSIFCGAVAGLRRRYGWQD